MRAVDLSQVTVVISVKPDSTSRLANLDRLVDYYRTFATNAELLVIEQGSEQTIVSRAGLNVHCVKDAGLHWKTRNMNLGAAISSRPYLLMSDCDTFPHPNSLRAGLQELERGRGFINLHNGIVVDISRSHTDTLSDWPQFVSSLAHFARSDVAPGDKHGDLKMRPLYGNANHRALGGCFLCGRASFFSIGGWNTNFVSYGFEDQEFFYRAQKLGHAFPFVEDHNLYHFNHARGMESRYGVFYRQNEAEFKRVQEMTADALHSYAMHGFRNLSFENGYDYARFSTEDADGWHRVSDARTDLSNLTILIVADPAIVRPETSCLEDLLTYLEENFRAYDLRICENGTTAFKYPGNRMQVAFRNTSGGPSNDEIEAILEEANRTYATVINLSRNSEEQLSELKVTFSKLRDGVPLSSVFQTAPKAIPNAL